ncbi:excision nuclease subunit A [Escherichia coli]|uniref:UvrABC system protein A n=1 Tax=Escherichia coli TaxID=562 RepID=A0A376VR38_ECOLX|nr:excision nuclease subunit A [Escherichia coli]
MDKIEVRGARTHNLKNINLVIPRDKLIVVTGLSGSGKSSLAFDTLYAEGQRRYVESLFRLRAAVSVTDGKAGRRSY